ncbi:hypothetical protein PUV54_00465 [Hyphococcus flavus]|uniref:Uncharacterized protein n=1 Tax=Hyphococcus flavus TaxID=1866326 RepID=A0AAE9ZBG9_9PROT|nr:hypothetical protein [Hyphococcus flavus]WDI31659.1 hypothetical protein PUV54_00465 [Hyphococcus flavus]
MLGQIFKFLTFPFRVFGRLLKATAREARASTKTTANAGGSVVAGAAAVELLQQEYTEEPPTGVETFLFTQLPRPRLTERSASELTLEQATEYAANARAFYGYRFPLFTRGDFFYEEVEQDYLNDALGFDANSIDRRFLEVTTLFRRTLNANTRRMLLYWMPALFLISFSAALFFLQTDMEQSTLSVMGVVGEFSAVVLGAGAVGAVLLAFFVFSWPYKVVQQRNLMNLDNYITSKFARINNNFQVAKRRALNVERDKRMGQREELKDEAGSWTLAYHWFAMRLFLCELVLRNKFYQMRRNTTLYWVGGLAVTAVLFVGFLTFLIADNASMNLLITFVGSSLVYVLLAGAIMRRATSMMFKVVESNEWSRFHIVDLDATIRDHVGEDKLQIVTFRDRNRFE